MASSRRLRLLQLERCGGGEDERMRSKEKAAVVEVR